MNNITSILGSESSNSRWSILDKSSLFSLTIDSATENSLTQVLTQNNFTKDGMHCANNRAEISYSANIPAGKINVVLELEYDGVEVVGVITVDIESSMTVRRVMFPCLQDATTTPYDNLLMSTPWGDNLQRPAMTIRQVCAGSPRMWIYDYIKCGENELIYTYPSIMAMQYMALHNPVNTLYLASYSTGDDTMTFHAQALGKTAIGMAIGHYPYLQDGKWRSPCCSIAMLDGDWHAAADLYASRMAHKFTNPDVPAWMKQGENGFHGWLGVIMHFEGHEPVLRYSDLPEVYDRAQAMGLNTLQIAGWANNGHDTTYPDYFIDSQLGTADDLREALATIQNQGGHTILYTNGRLVDPASQFFNQGGDTSLCLNADGESYTETYDSTPVFRIACPSCSEYHQYLGEQISKIFGDIGADAIQIDQISCNYAYHCHDKTHPHSTPANNYLPGIEQELNHLRKIYRDINSQSFVWCEGCHERFGQYYDIEQGHGEEYTWQVGESLPEQFHYTFPDRIVTGLSGSIQQLCHTYCQGKPFDFYGEMMTEGFEELVRELVAVRKRLPDYFIDGVFRDSVGLEFLSDIRAFALERRNVPGLMVNIWKPGASLSDLYQGTIKNPRPDWHCTFAYPQAAEKQEDGSFLRITWPGPVATLVFEP